MSSFIAMPLSLGSRVHFALLALLLCALLAGLAVYGRQLHDDVRTGIQLARNARTSEAAPTDLAEPLAGVTVAVPSGVTVLVARGGVLLKKDPDGIKGALVCPVIADRSVAASDLLTAVHRSWSAGMRDTSEAITLGTVKDEGATVRAQLDWGHGADAVAGELRVVRAPAGYRVEAFWTLKEEFDRERAALDALPRTVRLAPGQPLPIEVGKRHRALVPPGFNFVEDDGGIEVIARGDSRIAFGLATGTGNGGLKTPEELIETYVTRSKGLTNPTSGVVRAYPAVEAPRGQKWDITARDLEYEADGQNVSAVLTAALTTGPGGQAFILSVRQAPPDLWGKCGFTLSAIEASARFHPKGAGQPGLAIPLAHVESSAEMLEAWEIGRASRRDVRWREALLPLEERASPTTGRWWAIPPLLAQPDGTFLNPENALETLVRPD